jgi:hypothetical protein
MSTMMDTVLEPSAFRFTTLVRRVAMAFAGRPSTQIECTGADPRAAAAAKTVVRAGGHKVEFLYLVMTGIAAYGDRNDLEARARLSIAEAIQAADGRQQ